MNVKSWNIPTNCSSQLVHIQIDWLHLLVYSMHQHDWQTTLARVSNLLVIVLLCWLWWILLSAVYYCHSVTVLSWTWCVSVFLDICTIVHVGIVFWCADLLLVFYFFFTLSHCLITILFISLLYTSNKHSLTLLYIHKHIPDTQSSKCV